jgi:hypothetical protein
MDLDLIGGEVDHGEQRRVGAHRLAVIHVDRGHLAVERSDHGQLHHAALELGDHEALALHLARAVGDLEVQSLALQAGALAGLLQLDLGEADGVLGALVLDLVQEALGAQLFGALQLAACGFEADPAQLGGLIVAHVLLPGGDAGASQLGF